MNIAIEFIVILAVVLFVALWFIWEKLSKIFHSWRYKPENDRGLKSEKKRLEDIAAAKLSAGKPVAATKKRRFDRPAQPEQRAVLQEGTSSESGGNTSSPGKVSPTRARNPFRRPKQAR